LKRGTSTDIAFLGISQIGRKRTIRKGPNMKKDVGNIRGVVGGHTEQAPLCFSGGPTTALDTIAKSLVRKTREKRCLRPRNRKAPGGGKVKRGAKKRTRKGGGNLRNGQKLKLRSFWGWGEGGERLLGGGNSGESKKLDFLSLHTSSTTTPHHILHFVLNTKKKEISLTDFTGSSRAD